MKIAVLSDIHDNIWKLEKALEDIFSRKIYTAIFCGDYCSPTTFMIATEKFKSAYCAWGNVDGEKFRITQQIYKNKIDHVKLLGELGEVKIDKRKIAINHYPDIAQGLAYSDLYNAVFNGHTHQSKNEKVGKTLLVNPGAVCGIQEGKPRTASYAIYDTNTNSAEIIEIK
jgi:putative phosphoesterase